MPTDSSRHADPALTVRPPAQVKADAQTVLRERGLEMRAFVTACLAALAADPDQTLKQLTPHWPEDKPKGRPRRPRADDPAG
jgi:hypothetical protein